MLPCFFLQVGTADALAFFLPGVVSQYAKVLHVSKTMISGAAGSVEALDQAIRGLAEFLMIVLEDDANLSGLGIPKNPSTGFHSNEDESAVAFLQKLRQLPVKSHGQGETIVENSSAACGDTPKLGIKEKGSAYFSDTSGSFRINRTKDWIVSTSVHVDKLLSATFPHVGSCNLCSCLS